MNLLEICNRLAQEGAINGDPLLSSIEMQTGERKRVVDWANDALREILGYHRWPFLWENPTLSMAPGSNIIVTTVPESRWDKDQTWRVAYSGNNSDCLLDFIQWSQFSSMYRRLNAPGNITAWTLRPDNAMVFNAVCNTTPYTYINVQRWKQPVPMVVATDSPPFDADLHMLVVYTALKKLAGYDEAGNQRAVAIDEIKTLQAAFNERYLPSFSMGGSLLDNY